MPRFRRDGRPGPASKRLAAAPLLALFCLLPGNMRGQAQDERVVLRFEHPLAAVIHAADWDRTQEQWARGNDAGALFFDAAYRFLLVRFPKSADAVYARLAAGYAIESAHLELRRSACPWPHAPGYTMRIFALPEKEHTPEPRWRVGAWALHRPWIPDEAMGPTWNAYINGCGWWRSGGARCFSDRFPEALDVSEVSVQQPEGRLDVGRVFVSRAFGETVVARLRRVADHGFLICRTELSHSAFGGRALDTGAVPLYVERPVLVVRLRRGDISADLDALAPEADVRALAESLQAHGCDGMPTTRMPDNLGDLVRQWRARRRGEMPDWMWRRVREVWDLPHYLHGNPQMRDADSFTRLLKALDSADPDVYREVAMRWELDRAPGWFKGHSHVQDLLPLLSFPELLTGVVRYDRALAFQARWTLPLEPDRVFSQAKVFGNSATPSGIGTLNHMARARPKALLGGEVAGLPWVVEEARDKLLVLNRKGVYTRGFSCELGDSYYRGITLAGLQAGARFLSDPLMRLKAGLMVEKLLFEDVSTYHPGLRHRVSRAGRRMGGLYQYALGQNVPEAALHMLSRNGVLIETDRLVEGPSVHGINILHMHEVPPVQAALLAPWGAEWERHAVEDKTLPFRAMFKAYVWGGLDDPVHATTYMGRHYALGSEQVTGGSVPVFAAWRTQARTVERLPEMGFLMLQGRVNNMVPDVLDKTPMGALQHDNKLIWIVKPPERRFLERGADNLPAVLEEGLYNFRAQAAIHVWGRETPPEVWVGNRRIDELPAAARHEDILFIREGVTYLGLVPLPASDLGRTHEVLIGYDAPTLTIASHVLEREHPADLTEPFWQRLADATAGWVLEFGDEDEYGSFDAFRTHLLEARLQADWNGEERVLHVNYRSGTDTMEVGFRTAFARSSTWHESYRIPDVFAYQRVNGRWPWLPEGIHMDSPLGVMGTSARLEKGGATLDTAEGQMAFLKVEPISASYTGINPFLDPTPFRLSTPEGVEVWSEGPLTLARVTARPRENELRVDCHLPLCSHVQSLRRLRTEFVLTPGGEYLSPTHLQAIPPGGRLAEIQSRPRPPFFPGEVIAAEDVPRVAARALFVRGFEGPPSVVLNGKPLPGPFARFVSAGASVYRIPIAE